MERSIAVLALLALAACQSTPPPPPAPGSGPPVAAATEPAAPEAPAADVPETEAQRLLAERVLRFRIEAEKRDVVARHFLEQGRVAYRQTRFEEARTHLRRAIDLDPSPGIRGEAEDLLQIVEGVGMNHEAVFEHVVARANVQNQQAIAEVRVLMQEGQDRLARGDFDGAFDRFEKAEEILRWMPSASPRETLLRRGTAARE